ncbi:MAG: alpha-amylase, partial [Butyrivibrio sp.]|nr:alpha-amylase [Butyrivibrio sp.]
EACHARGIRVINDMVMNHSSVAHPWFTEAAAYLRTLPAGEEPDAAVCPTVDWYRFSREPQKGYEPLPGTEWYYEARFWSGMPDFNLENPEVRQAFQEIAAFWLAHGCDGFRMDAVTSYETDDTEGSVAELARFAEDVHALSPEAYIVGEAWADVATYARFYDSGIDSLFDFDFAGSEGAIAKAVRGNLKADQFAQRIVDNEGLFAAHNPDYINAPFYTNHDMARSAGYYLKQGEACTKQAEGLNLLMGGNAFLYYGEELGMRGSGRDENKRAPMLWSNDPDAPGMCAGPPEMETIEHKCGSLAAQASDPESIYQYVKRAIRLRNTFPAIARGESRMVEALSDERVCVLERRVLQEDSAACGEAVILVINLDPEPRMLDLKADPSTAAAELAGMLTISPEESVVETPERMLQLPGRGIAILQAAAEEQ